ncbi:MAG: hypothetical protein J2P21_11515, partial [Chloracidobacterium sp.]|nr:hypothetical protein [Chloracidobacterium sp.]
MHPAGEDVDGAEVIGVCLEPTCHAHERGLRLAVSALTWPHAGHSRLVLRRRHSNELSAVPCQLVIKLPSEFEPALVEDG